MKKITKEIIVDRYKVHRGDIEHWNFLNMIGLDYDMEIKVRVILNTASNRSYLDRLFLGENSEYKHDFNSRKDCIDYAKESGYTKFGCISIYQENGYVGVKFITGDDAFNKVPNNWVDHGRNQNIAVVLYEDEKDVEQLPILLEIYLNYGFDFIEIYDEKEEAYIDEGFLYTRNNDKEFEKWKQEMIKEYGFKEGDFE